MIELRQTAEFLDWHRGLKDRKAARIIASRLLRMGGGLLGDVRAVGEGVSEARIAFGPGYRMYFVQRGGLLIVLLCGGDKGSQQRDIARAHDLATRTV